MGFLNNKIVQVLLAVCILVGLNFHISAGSQGVSMGVERVSK